MPQFLEDKLKHEYGAKSKIPYKVMNKIGAMRGNQETAKGRRMEAKHKEDSRKRMQADMAKIKGESHSYDWRRPKQKIVSRYNG